MEPTENLPDYLNRLSVHSLPATKQRILEQAVTSPKFYTVIYDYNTTDDDHTIYILEYGILEPFKNEVKVYRVKSRYSKILKLYEEVKSIYGTRNLPSFPGKKYFGNNTDKLAKDRSIQMAPFIHKLNTYPSICDKPIFQSIFPEFKNNIPGNK